MIMPDSRCRIQCPESGQCLQLARTRPRVAIHSDARRRSTRYARLIATHRSLTTDSETLLLADGEHTVFSSPFPPALSLADPSASGRTGGKENSTWMNSIVHAWGIQTITRW